MKAILRRTRISPKKASLVACLVRNKNVVEALDILKFTPKKAAHILKKLIASAIANAVNNDKQNKNNLIIKEIIVTEGPTQKRSIPVSRGRAHRLLKRTSHIRVRLEAEKSEAPKEKPQHKEEKAETTTEKKPTITVKKAEPKKSK